MVADIASYDTQWQSMDFFVDGVVSCKDLVRDRPERTLSGTFENFRSQATQYDGICVALGDNVARLQYWNIINKMGVPWATLLHPMAAISRDAIIGAGSVIMAGSVVGSGSWVSAMCIVNSGATVDHDCRLGIGVHISPGAHLGGCVQVGDASWVGIGACVCDHIDIGCNVTVGAGAVVVSSLPGEVVAYGNPASIKRVSDKSVVSGRLRNVD